MPEVFSKYGSCSLPGWKIWYFTHGKCSCWLWCHGCIYSNEMLLLEGRKSFVNVSGISASLLHIMLLQKIRYQITRLIILQHSIEYQYLDKVRVLCDASRWRPMVLISSAPHICIRLKAECFYWWTPTPFGFQ